MRARDNPFSVDRVLLVRYRPIGATWDELLDRLAAHRYRGSIVGPEGSGKTTLLEDLEPRLRSMGFRVRMTKPRKSLSEVSVLPWPSLLPTDLAAEDFVLIDGADDLGRVAWSRVLRRTARAGGLVITSHRTGRLPTLIECRTSPELLAEIVRELLGDTAGEIASSVRGLFHAHRGNLRTALRELYDVYAAR